MIKYSIKLLGKNKIMTAFVCLILAVTLVLTIICVSSVYSRISEYLPLREVLSSEGLCIYGDSNGVMPGIVNYSYEDVKSIQPDKISAVYMTQKINLYDEDNGTSFAYSYNDEMAKLYKPKMFKGKWLDKSEKPKDKYLPVVVSYASGYRMNEIIKNGNTKMKVCGILAKDAKIISTDYTSNAEKPDFRNMYEKADNCNVYARCSDVEKLNIPQYISGRIFVRYKSGLTAAQKLSLHRDFYQFGVLYGLDNELNVHSMNYIRKDIILILPITLCILVLTLISSAAACAISAKINKRTFEIFTLCGAKRSTNVAISLLGGVLTTLLSCDLAFTVINIIEKLTISKNIIITLDIPQLLICGAVAMVNILLSYVMAIILVGRKGA